MVKKNSRRPVVNPVVCTELCQVPTCLEQDDLESLAMQCVPSFYFDPYFVDFRDGRTLLVNVFIFRRLHAELHRLDYSYHAVYVCARNWLNAQKIRSLGLLDSDFICAFPIRFPKKLNF